MIYYLSDEMKLLFYNAYVLSLFDYGYVVWGIQTTYYVNKAFNIKKRGARIILTDTSP